MNFAAAAPLKSFDPSERLPISAPSRGRSSAGGPPQEVRTRLSPADLAGVVSHPKKGTPAEVPPGTDPDAVRHEELTRQAQQWVGQTFFGVLLKQMRESPFRSDLFEGGRGGQAFGPLFDQKLIDHMSRGTNHNLVRAIVRKMEAGAAYRKQQAQPAGGVRPASGVEAPRAVEPVTDVAASADSEHRPGLGRSARGRTPAGRAPAAAKDNPYKFTRTHVAAGVGS